MQVTEEKVIDLQEEIETKKEEEFKIKGLEEALETTKNKDEKVRPYVDEYYDSIVKKIEDENLDYDLLDAFSTISKLGLCLSQSYFEDKNHFDEEYKLSRKLVSENILQALGVNADDDEKNKSGVVTYNGEIDLDNFSLRRILMISSQLTEYALWQLTLTKTFEQLSQEYMASEE